MIARLEELLGGCPDFPEARSMLGAALRGTLRPDPRGFREATIPPSPPRAAPLPASDERAIPRAPLLPRITPQNVAPSYAPPRAPSSGDSRSPSERTTDPSPGSFEGHFSSPPTPFAIATWLSERDFERALAAVERLGAESSPELTLLEVRALVGLGRRGGARRSLDRLCRAPLLDPDLRAAAARLLIELGDVDRAEAQARRAANDDPASPFSRLTLAWAIARKDAWLPSGRSATELGELLGDFAADTCPLPALGYALFALSLLPTAPEAARQAAQQALDIDPQGHDALAVAAVVAQSQQRSADAKRLYQRLLDLDHHVADELSATLGRLDAGARARSGPAPGSVSVAPAAALGSAVTAAPAAAPARPSLSPLTSRARPPTPSRPSPWGEKEQRLALGDGKAALFDFEQGLARKLEDVSARAGASELSAVAKLTARHLTEAAISRHFAPFDLSLFSIARLDVALGLLYRGGVGPRTELRTRALLGLGAYLGECLRQAYAGEWSGGSVNLLLMHVEGQGLCFSPFRDMNARLQTAQPLEVRDTPLPHPGADPLGHSVALSLAPPAPWDPAPWPAPSELPELGARLRESPVGLYCAGVELPLDLSFASLRSLDRYVTLLAPPLAPSDPDANWVRRAAVLVGAYVGEVLRATRGASWEPAEGALSVDAYRLTLPGSVTALPVAAAFERLSGRRLEQPSDYARRITG